MFHGSKFSLSLSLDLFLSLDIYWEMHAYVGFVFINLQNVHVFLQETENHERSRCQRIGFCSVDFNYHIMHVSEGIHSLNKKKMVMILDYGRDDRSWLGLSRNFI